MLDRPLKEGEERTQTNREKASRERGDTTNKPKLIKGEENEGEGCRL